jgi:hypothetical protein
VHEGLPLFPEEPAGDDHALGLAVRVKLSQRLAQGIVQRARE